MYHPPEVLKNKSNKLRYCIFILTVLITIIVTDLIVQYNIDLQVSDARVINMAGRQRMLSQLISKKILSINSIEDRQALNSLFGVMKEFKSAHESLSLGKEDIENTPEINKLYVGLQPYYDQIRTAINNLDSIKEPDILERSQASILMVEQAFLKNMDNIVLAYQRNAEKKLNRTKSIVLLLSCVSILILLGQFFFIIAPLFRTLKNQNKEMTISNRHLSDFAHITSHNLRAPLNNLNTLLYIYDITKDEAEKKDIIEKLKYVTTNLNRTMDTLVDALKTQFDSTKVTTVIQLNEVLSKTIDSLSETIKSNAVTIDADFSVLKTVKYNPTYLESIFLNLIGNSIKYKSPDRKTKINIKSNLIKGKPVITFADNSLGIDLKANGKNIFGLGKTFHKHPDARGVGLFMTRTQLESMGGTIEVESKVGIGTTFTITL